MKNQLKRLILRNFKSAVGELIIGFPDNGMMLLEGRNLNTGGSSGAGKSMVMTGLNMALGCSSHPMTKAQSWFTDEKPEIVLEWTNSKHGLCVLSRGKRSSLKLGDAKAIEAAGTITEELRRLFGAESALLKILTYSPQQDFDDFIKMDNAKKQEFLATILDLHQYEEAVEAAIEALKGLATEEAQKQDRVKIFEGQLQAAQKMLEEAKAAFVVESSEDLERRIAGHHQSRDSFQRQYSEQETKLRLLNQTERPKRLLEARSRFLAAGADADQCLHEAQMKLNEVQSNLPAPFESEVATAARIKIGHQKLAEVEATDRVRHDAFLKQCQELDSKIATIRAESRQVPALEEKARSNQKAIDQAKAEIEKLEKNLCPTCGQQWAEGQARIITLQNQIKTAQAAIIDAVAASVDIKARADQLVPLQTERAVLKFTPDPLLARIRDGIGQLEAQLRSLQQQRNDQQRAALEAAAKEVSLAQTEAWEVQQKVKAAEAEVEAQLRNEQDEINRVMTDIRQTIDNETSQARRLEAEVAVLKERMRSGEARVKSAETNVERVQAEYDKSFSEMAAVQAKANVEREFIRITGREGFLGRIFDEVLTEISTEANNILARVANTAHVTIQFQSEFQNAKGMTEKKIRTRVFVSGNETDCDQTGISGGMLSAVRLAVKIAIRRVVFRRADIHLGWNCLDESFDGLDPVSKEACFEILSEEARDGLVMVVDHSPEFKSMFNQSIILEYKDGLTKLAEAA